MKLQPTDHFKVSDEVLSQEVNGETVLLDLDGESYFGLNDVGTRIWQLLKEDLDVSGMLDTLDGEYEVSRGQLESDVTELLGSLAESGLIELSEI